MAKKIYNYENNITRNIIDEYHKNKTTVKDKIKKKEIKYARGILNINSEFNTFYLNTKWHFNVNGSNRYYRLIKIPCLVSNAYAIIGISGDTDCYDINDFYRKKLYLEKDYIYKAVIKYNCVKNLLEDNDLRDFVFMFAANNNIHIEDNVIEPTLKRVKFVIADNVHYSKKQNIVVEIYAHKGEIIIPKHVYLSLDENLPLASTFNFNDKYFYFRKGNKENGENKVMIDSSSEEIIKKVVSPPRVSDLTYRKRFDYDRDCITSYKLCVKEGIKKPIIEKLVNDRKYLTQPMIDLIRWRNKDNFDSIKNDYKLFNSIKRRWQKCKTIKRNYYNKFRIRYCNKFEVSPYIYVSITPENYPHREDYTGELTIKEES